MNPFLALCILEFGIILLLLAGYRASILRGYARLETYLQINDKLASMLRESQRATKMAYASGYAAGVEEATCDPR